MKAVILAGGRGSRLHPVTLEIPKPLLPVKKRPIINHLLDLFIRYGTTDFIITVNEAFLTDFKKWKLEHYPSTKIEFVVEKKPVGTFGSLITFTKDWAEGKPFFVTNGDELKEINLSDMAEHHTRYNALITIALHKVKDATGYGVVVFDQKYKVEAFIEKPQKPFSSYVSAGLYLVEPAVFDHPWQEGFLMFEKDVFPKLARKGKLYAYPKMKRWQDCGTFERWQKAIENW